MPLQGVLAQAKLPEGWSHNRKPIDPGSLFVFLLMKHLFIRLRRRHVAPAQLQLFVFHSFLVFLNIFFILRRWNTCEFRWTAQTPQKHLREREQRERKRAEGEKKKVGHGMQMWQMMTEGGRTWWREKRKDKRIERRKKEKRQACKNTSRTCTNPVAFATYRILSHYFVRAWLENLIRATQKGMPSFSSSLLPLSPSIPLPLALSISSLLVWNSFIPLGISSSCS